MSEIFTAHRRFIKLIYNISSCNIVWCFKPGRVLWLSVSDVLSYLSVCVSGVCRVKKLKETLVAVQQLDKNMNSLRSWLAHIETELSRPIVYETCDSHEIQRKLCQQQVGHTCTQKKTHYSRLIFCVNNKGKDK